MELSKQSSKPSPVFSAVMCDGMGWFSPTDYKRALLLYDEIHYLIPKTTVEFHDVSGRKVMMNLPVAYYDKPSFKVHYYDPDESLLDLIVVAATRDALSPTFAATVDAIPLSDRIYTWRIANSDAGLGKGRSLGLTPDQYSLAHSILLNKFLLAADKLNCIPITGKPYIHALIFEKYLTGLKVLRETRPDLLPAALQERQSHFNPVASELMSNIIPDVELENRTDAEIIEYKNRNRKLFELFSYRMRQLVGEVHSLPLSSNFEAEIKELINTEIWREQREIDNELRSAWSNFFKSSTKVLVSGAVSGAVTVGIAPWLSLGSVTVASILAAAATAVPWASAELISFLEKRKQAQEHGLYYLARFKG